MIETAPSATVAYLPRPSSRHTPQIGPGGLEPPFPDPKSGVLPLDEGPAMLPALNLGRARTPWKALTLPLGLPRSIYRRPSRWGRPLATYCPSYSATIFPCFTS